MLMKQGAYRCWVVLAWLSAGQCFAETHTPLREIAGATFDEWAANTVADSRVAAINFNASDARFVRIVINRSYAGAACIDEVEVYGPAESNNLALASRGGVASASSVISGFPIHAVTHLNDGLYGNDHSWIPASDQQEWAQIELPATTRVNRVIISRDRNGVLSDRQVLEAEICLSLDGREWRQVARLSRSPDQVRGRASLTFPVGELTERTWAGAVKYAFLRERDTWSRIHADDYLSPLLNDRPAEPDGQLYWRRMVTLSPVERALVQFEDMINRLAKSGLNVSKEKSELMSFRERNRDDRAASSDDLFLAVRQAKRRLFFRDPALAPLETVLFAKRHPYNPSHNYSEHLDGMLESGGGICVLKIPHDAEGRLDPAKGVVNEIFDASAGIARDPSSDFDAQTVYFAYRPEKTEKKEWKQSYWHLMSMQADGGNLRQLTEGSFQDFDPLPLPDGGIAFNSTRCAVRFLCWEPQAYMLHRLDGDGTIRRLSYANVSEWSPSLRHDGRILWTRSEYLDKGADFGHTLWAIYPDGTHPELVFGNDTPYGYGQAHEVPGSREIVCTLISHGDQQGAIVLIDPSKGLYNTEAITSITPDTRPQYQMDRSHVETFQEVVPVSKDCFLVSHNPGRNDHWCLYVIDRYGNRELLYLDGRISSKQPSLLCKRERPPVLAGACDKQLAKEGLGQFTVQDVYNGLGNSIERGRVRYLQISEEVPPRLDCLPDGEYRFAYRPFGDFYATPSFVVNGPPHQYLTRAGNALQPHAFRQGHAGPTNGGMAVVTETGGWPTYVAKRVIGTVRVADDGAVGFTAPAGKVLYFQLLDRNYNELQRMRSVIQLQPGERRSCIGCHDDRLTAPAMQSARTAKLPIQNPEPPPWGAEPFSYERVVQPVLDANCVRCHDGADTKKSDLRGNRGTDRIPASYRTLIAGGWVDYFDCIYGARHFKAEPLSFGSLKSRLFVVLDGKQHKEVTLKPDDLRAIKAWIDLNCPLWPDYTYRFDRPK